MQGHAVNVLEVGHMLAAFALSISFRAWSIYWSDCVGFRRKCANTCARSGGGAQL